MWNDRYGAGAWPGVMFDPATLTMASMGATAVGAATSAAGTLAGGSAAAAAGQMQQNAANYQATQTEENATQAIASSQRTMLDTQLKTNLAISANRANAAGNGVNAGAGSAVTNAGNLARRGAFQAAMDLFNGQSTATGLNNQAAGERYSGVMAEEGGQMQQSASELAAAGTLAGGAGNMLKTYGAFTNPTSYGKPGVGYYG